LSFVWPPSYTCVSGSASASQPPRPRADAAAAAAGWARRCPVYTEVGLFEKAGTGADNLNVLEDVQQAEINLPKQMNARLQFRSNLNGINIRSVIFSLLLFKL